MEQSKLYFIEEDDCWIVWAVYQAPATISSPPWQMSIQSAAMQGWTSERRNRTCTADWLSEVCRNVERAPLLLPLTGKNIVPLSVHRREDAGADIDIYIYIRATGFWGSWCQQCAFLIFHPNAQSYRHSSIPSLYRRHEQTKKREYGDRIREVENGTFTPLTCVCHNRRHGSWSYTLL